MPINLVNAVVRVKVEWIGLRLTLIGRDIRSFSRGLVVNASPGDIQPRQDCSQDFQRRGHRGYSRDCHVDRCRPPRRAEV